jgi:DNA-binding NarL/FixJ family response regulator
VLIAADSADGPHVLIVTTFDQDEHVFRALRSGAGGFILKDSPPEQLLHAIRVVASGDALLTPSITRRMISAFARQPAAPAPRSNALTTLTDREREVLQHIAVGRSNAEIGAALYVSVATIKTHVGRLLTKLEARDRAQLVVFAYESGMVVPGGTGESSDRDRMVLRGEGNAGANYATPHRRSLSGRNPADPSRDRIMR